MSLSSPPSSLAERLRAARLAVNKTQHDLAGGNYSKAYISAIERGKMTPSVQALGLLAERLGLPASYFLGEGEADLDALAAAHATPGMYPRSAEQMQEEAAHLTLDEAEGWLRLHQPEEALRVLQVSAGPPAALPRLEQPRWRWLAGWALQEAGRLAEAIDHFTEGLALANTLSQQARLADRAALVELAERLRCALGVCMAEAGEVDRAFDLHQQGWAAVQAGQVSDPEVQLQLALALGHDYLALGRPEGAQPLYETTRPLLEEHEDVQAQRAWERAQRFNAQGYLRLAEQAMQQALTGWALLDAQHQAVQVQALIGKALLGRQDYAAAEPLLQQSLERARQAGDTRMQADTLQMLAQLFLSQGDLAQAMTIAAEGLQIAAQSGDLRAQGHLSLTLAAASEAQGQGSAAEHAYQEAIAALEQTTDKALLGEAHARYGQFLQRQERYEAAFQQMQLALHPVTP